MASLEPISGVNTFELETQAKILDGHKNSLSHLTEGISSLLTPDPEQFDKDLKRLPVKIDGKLVDKKGLISAEDLKKEQDQLKKTLGNEIQVLKKKASDPQVKETEEELNKKIASLKKKLALPEKQRADMNGEIRKLNQDINRFNKEIEELTGKVNTEKSNQTAINIQITEVRRKIEEHDKQINALKEKKAEVGKVIEDIQKDVADLKKKLPSEMLRKMESELNKLDTPQGLNDLKEKLMFEKLKQQFGVKNGMTGLHQGIAGSLATFVNNNYSLKLPAGSAQKTVGMDTQLFYLSSALVETTLEKNKDVYSIKCKVPIYGFKDADKVWVQNKDGKLQSVELSKLPKLFDQYVKDQQLKTLLRAEIDASLDFAYTPPKATMKVIVQPDCNALFYTGPMSDNRVKVGLPDARPQKAEYDPFPVPSTYAESPSIADLNRIFNMSYWAEKQKRAEEAGIAGLSEDIEPSSRSDSPKSTLPAFEANKSYADKLRAESSEKSPVQSPDNKSSNPSAEKESSASPPHSRDTRPPPLSSPK